MSIFIGGAWPYANGSLHLGHIAALLPGDILARYYRLKGERVLYVSGSDCNGTPISIRANQEGVAFKISQIAIMKNLSKALRNLDLLMIYIQERIVNASSSRSTGFSCSCLRMDLFTKKRLNKRIVSLTNNFFQIGMWKGFVRTVGIHHVVINVIIVQPSLIHLI